MNRLIGYFAGICRKACGATVVKVLSLTSVATLVRVCTGLVSVKVVAAVFGPAGVAMLGQLGNFTNIAQTLAGGGICNGITKYVSEHKDNASLTSQYLSAALKITLVCSVVCGLLMICLSGWLSRLVMFSSDYAYVFTVFGVTIALYALNAALLAAVNGFKLFRKYVVVSIANSIAGAAFTVALALLCGLGGALVAAVTYQSVVFVVTLWLLRRQLWLRLCSLRGRIPAAVRKGFGGFAVMSLVTAIVVPLVQMLLRGHIMTDISASEAGVWEGMQKISSVYMMVVTTSLSVYYLPRLSELHSPALLRREILRAYALIVPLLAGGFVLIYFMRFLIIRLLFTPEFASMQALFAWQMAGDLLRVVSWLLAFMMVAKAMTVHYVVTEIASSLIYLLLGYALVCVNGVVGLVQANLINYAIYFAVMLFIFRKILFTKQIKRSNDTE